MERSNGAKADRRGPSAATKEVDEMEAGVAETTAAVGANTTAKGSCQANAAAGGGKNMETYDMAKAGSVAQGDGPVEAASAPKTIEGLADGLPGQGDEADRPPDVPRDRKGRFLKGQSGNPSGRPKTDPKVKRILKAATADAAKLLADIVVDEGLSMNIRVDCAKEILNRVYGRSTQIVDAGVDSTIRLLLSPEAEPYAG